MTKLKFMKRNGMIFRIWKADDVVQITIRRIND